jgi:peptidoglycan hydrolase CwlO-like protein
MYRRLLFSLLLGSISAILAVSAGFAVVYAQVATTTSAAGAGTDMTASSTNATNNSSSTAALQSQIDANNQQITSLNQQIAQYQQEILQAGANKKTLQAAINSLNLQKSQVQAQVALTEAQISTTQLQIQQLGGEIVSAQQTISSDQGELGEYLRILQKSDSKPLIMQILSSGNITDVWGDVNATLEVQGAVQNQMAALQAEEGNLSNSKTASQQKQVTLTSQQQALTSQQQALVATAASKAQLLAETNSQEATYEKLLAAAEAQLQSFSAFTQNAGGSKLLGNQTVCDSWGCYYSQRDSAWGNDPLDGTKYTLASDGCLITSMAMVLTHYGYRDVTPVTINSNPANFAAYYPAYLLTTINVDGVSATRKSAAIDATLATGNPVIVGLNAYGGTHFVVLVSGSRGNYLMRDPYIANGNNISFAANYSMRDIFGITKVIISS